MPLSATFIPLWQVQMVQQITMMMKTLRFVSMKMRIFPCSLAYLLHKTQEYAANARQHQVGKQASARKEKLYHPAQHTANVRPRRREDLAVSEQKRSTHISASTAALKLEVLHTTRHV